jgi:hypothetical protein
MLIEQLKTMQQLLEARSEHRNEKKQLQALDDHEKQLKEVLSKWQGVATVASRLGYNGDIVTQVREAALFAETRFKNTTTLAPSDVRSLSNHIEAFKQDAHVRWNTYKNALITDTLQARIQIIYSIGLPTTRGQLLQLNAQLTRLQALDLPSGADLDRLADVVNQIEQTVKEALPEMSAEVADFLERLSTGTARLTDVTPLIVEWCKENGLLDRVTLRFERN